MTFQEIKQLIKENKGLTKIEASKIISELKK
jgi:hypothetical protein